MTLYNRYILWLTLLFVLTSVIMVFAGVASLKIYFSVYLVETLALTVLFSSLDPRARRSLSAVNYILFIGFLVIVATAVTEIIWGVTIP